MIHKISKCIQIEFCLLHLLLFSICVCLRTNEITMTIKKIICQAKQSGKQTCRNTFIPYCLVLVSYFFMVFWNDFLLLVRFLLPIHLSIKEKFCFIWRINNKMFVIICTWHQMTCSLRNTKMLKICMPNANIKKR